LLRSCAEHNSLQSNFRVACYFEKVVNESAVIVSKKGLGRAHAPRLSTCENDGG
jgi:hypothetical protein